MLDFIKMRCTLKTKTELLIYPDFVLTSDMKDLMIRGGKFYAIWDEANSIWSRDFYRLIDIVDREISQYVEENRETSLKVFEDANWIVKYMKYESSGLLYKLNRVIKESSDKWTPLDQKPLFSDHKTKREDYASFKLPYSLDKKESGIEGYNKLMDTLYLPEERRKLEWAIGCCLCGDNAKVQKFIALYGSPGSGKGTILDIIERWLLPGYTTSFDAAGLGSRGNQFALDSFGNDPIVAIQQDADMSRIDDNTKFNSVVSHEVMKVNEKYKAPYTKMINAFIFIGTNSPIKITDARSGLGRRLIDVTTSGNTLSHVEYNDIMSGIEYALGGIAHHCIQVYKKLGKMYYDAYKPIKMFGLTNDVYNFIEDHYFDFVKNKYVSMSQIWPMYVKYMDDTNSTYKLKRRILLNELQYYFKSYKEEYRTDDGKHLRQVLLDLREDLFTQSYSQEDESALPEWLTLKHQDSAFDIFCQSSPAQYANENGTPRMKWSNVTTRLIDIDTSMLHYVQPPENLITIDFDKKDENGEKSLQLNIEAARKWPPTYAEVSKSGKGLHLQYVYEGDCTKLSNLFEEDVEIKTSKGNSSLRRMLTLCNNYEVAHISSGLPLKEDKKMLDANRVKSEKGLRRLIERNLRKEIMPGTKPSIDFIKKILDDAYEDGFVYNVENLRPRLISFAAGSTHHPDYCLTLIGQMKLRSKDDPIDISGDGNIAFYDVEVFPNLFLVNWKYEGEGKPVTRMINPTPEECEELTHLRLIGFNCRRYDNHIVYARMMGYSNEQLYKLSQKIINGDRNAFFGEAYNLSYTDVYDFSSKKQSLKKFEIELGIHHKELGLPWDKPVPEDMWPRVAEYCDNDVIATEAVFNARKADFVAREILSEIAGMSVNTPTNSLTARIIFGKNRSPQNAFNYRNLADNDGTMFCYQDVVDFLKDKSKRKKWKQALPYFPGYKYEAGKSTYRGEEVGEGGYVYAEPGMSGNIALLDVQSMHPTSAIDEELFGPYTSRFKDIKEARIAIKHGDFDKAKHMFDGKLTKYLEDEELANSLSYALKIAINSVYGLTAAKFDNPFKDMRNKDNIVAKRGALFMIDLKHIVQDVLGYNVAHIKTDSIKIPDATPEVIDIVMQVGEMYGYKFEHEATYDRMCLVNDAVYIAKYRDSEECKNQYGYIPDKNIKKSGKWDATGTQFQVPYVFKTLFSKEPIEFKDVCETKSVTSSLYLDMNESLKDGEHNYVFVGRVGSFCPIKPGFGGGLLMREKDGKYYAATGTKGFRWLEAETIGNLDLDQAIDISYYDALVQSAIKSISEYGDYDWFVSDEPYVNPPTPKDE